MATDPGRALVDFVLTQDGMFDARDAVHVDDGRGWCKTCGGPQSGRHRYPCDIRGALEAARKVRGTDN